MAKPSDQGKQEKPRGTGKVGDGSTGGWTGKVLPPEDFRPDVVTPAPKTEEVRDTRSVIDAPSDDSASAADNQSGAEDKE